MTCPTEEGQVIFVYEISNMQPQIPSVTFFDTEGAKEVGTPNTHCVRIREPSRTKETPSLSPSRATSGRCTEPH